LKKEWIISGPKRAMTFAAALIYWVIVALWLTVLITLAVFYARNPRLFGTTRLLLSVVAIDTSRNIVENIYFGVYFGGQYGIFPAAVVGLLGEPVLLILPKILNVVAGCVVLGLLLLRWLPSAVREHSGLEKNIDDAQRLNSMMDEFVANVSHELRTPLTSIAGSLGLLAAGVAGKMPVAAVRLISIAHENAQRLVRLTNDILDIGKIESGNMTFDFAPIDLRAATERAIDASHAFAQGHAVSIRIDMESQSCLVRADPDRLAQILTNLLSNAIKFSPSGGEVVVAIERRGRMGVVTVRDQGPGIPEEFKSRIFGKFAQAKHEDARRKGGSGLGLNIVANIVAQHGGIVGFEDAPLGGTLFYFEIPLWETDAMGALAQPSAQLSAAV
jgi:signal transduction histidine kinase